MRCPHCKAKNPDNAVFCAHCDGWILGPVYRETTHPPRRSKHGGASLKTWWKPVISCVAMITIVISVFWIISLIRQYTDPPLPDVSENHIQQTGAITPYTYENKLCFVYNDTFLETPYSNYQSFSVSLDGRSAAVLTDDQTLLYIRDNAVQEIGKNVTHYILSTNGDGVVFQDESKRLSHYHIETDIMDVNPYRDPVFGDFSISPDGNTLAFFVNDGLSGMLAYTLIIWHNGELSTRLVHYGESPTIISVSNNGDLVYTKYENKIFCINANGQQNAIGLPHIQSYITISNADHTQLFFFGNDGTYLSEQGKAARKISYKHVYPVDIALTQSAYDGFAITHSSNDLTKQIYYDYSTGGPLSSVLPRYNLWQLAADGSCQNLVSDCYYFWLDPSARYLYYQGSDDALWLLDLQNNNEHRMLVSNVEQYTVTYDCSTVYYISDQTLYALHLADGSVQAIQSDIGHITLLTTRDNQFYIIENPAMQFHKLYIYQDGKMEPVIEQVASFERTANGSLYITTNDAYYLCAADGTLKKLRTINPLVPKPLETP